MDAFIKEFFIKEAITCVWTGQAVENFYNPRSRWHDSSTLRVRLHTHEYSMYELVDSFNWERSPQGLEYWQVVDEE